MSSKLIHQQKDFFFKMVVTLYFPLMDPKSYKKYKILLLNIELELKAEHVPAEDLKRTMKACGGAIMATANDINSSFLGQCDYFEERQVGGERFNILQEFVH
ncbi:T-complex protein 1 subunit eta-like [Eurosta solidaginis]|uniref:T-complex protein 1 subunit eta-like n=1 Tax=Eurosta solidaginis TaxID=178769 RepID=UPI00353108AC